MAHQLTLGSKTLAWVTAAVLLMPPAECRAQSIPTSLNIVDIRGEGATGRVLQRTPENPAIRVVDERAAPIAGAVVVFTLPTEGPTGVFSNGEKTLAVITDSSGTAVAQGLRFNEVPGKVQVHINVSFKGLASRTNILQLSEAPAGFKPSHHGSGKIVAIIAVLAGGGAAGALFATRKNSSSPAAPAPAAPLAIGITPGTGTLAPPH